MNSNYTEINVQKLSSSIFKRWWLILLCFLLSFGLAWLLSNYYVSPVYKAETTLFLGKEDNSTGGISITDLQINNQLVVDYREIIKSHLVLDDVIFNLKLDMAFDAFQRRVQVTTIKDSRIFKISYEDNNPQQSALVANKLASTIIDKAAKIFNIKNVQLIDLAYPPKDPIRPDKLTYYIVGAVLGIILGIIFSLFAEFMDKTLKRPEDVERHLGLSVIGTIPKVSIDNSKEVIFGNSPTRINFSKELVVYYQPKSYASEAYRNLQANIQNNTSVKTLMITSPSPDEGKSTTAANLALSLARSGERVLIVDADLRNPRLHEYFGVLIGMGLTDILQNDEDTRRCILQLDGVQNLFLMTSGSAKTNPLEAMNIRKLKILFDNLKSQFDIVIVDTPPVGEVTDPIIIGGIVDNIVMVLSSGETGIEAAKQAKKALQTIGNGQKLIGTSISKYKMKSNSYDSSHYLYKIS